MYVKSLPHHVAHTSRCVMLWPVIINLFICYVFYKVPCSCLYMLCVL